MADDDFVDEYAFDLKIDAKKTMQWQSKIRDAHKEEFDMSDSEDGGAGDESDGAEDFDLSDDGSQGVDGERDGDESLSSRESKGRPSSAANRRINPVAGSAAYGGDSPLFPGSKSADFSDSTFPMSSRGGEGTNAQQGFGVGESTASNATTNRSGLADDYGGRDSHAGGLGGGGSGGGFALDREAKQKLSGSTTGMLQTRRDLDDVRWSQDSAVKAAMEAAEKKEAAATAGSSSGGGGGGGWRGGQTAGGMRASIDEHGESYDDDDDGSNSAGDSGGGGSSRGEVGGSSSIGTSSSYAPTPTSKKEKERKETIMSPLSVDSGGGGGRGGKFTSDRDDDDTGGGYDDDDDFEEEEEAESSEKGGGGSGGSGTGEGGEGGGGVVGRVEAGQGGARARARVRTGYQGGGRGGGGVSSGGEDYEDEEEEYEDDDQPSPLALPPALAPKALGLVPPPSSSSSSSSSPLEASADKVESRAALARAVDKLCKWGRADFDEGWGDQGLVKRDELVSVLSEYEGSLSKPLSATLARVSTRQASAKHQRTTHEGDSDSDDDDGGAGGCGAGGGGLLAGEALYGALWDQVRKWEAARGNSSPSLATATTVSEVALRAFLLSEEEEENEKEEDEEQSASKDEPPPAAADEPRRPSIPPPPPPPPELWSTPPGPPPFKKVVASTSNATKPSIAVAAMVPDEVAGISSEETAASHQHRHSHEAPPPLSSSSSSSPPSADAVSSVKETPPPETTNRVPAAAPGDGDKKGGESSPRPTSNRGCISGGREQSPSPSSSSVVSSAAAASESDPRPRHAQQEAWKEGFLAAQRMATTTTAPQAQVQPLVAPSPSSPQPQPPLVSALPRELAEFAAAVKGSEGGSEAGSKLLPLSELSCEEVRDLLWGLGFGASSSNSSSSNSSSSRGHQSCRGAGEGGGGGGDGRSRAPGGGGGGAEGGTVGSDDPAASFASCAYSHGVDGSLLELAEHAHELEEVGLSVRIRAKKLLHLLGVLKTWGPWGVGVGVVPKALLAKGARLRGAWEEAENNREEHGRAGKGVGYRPGEKRFSSRGADQLDREAEAAATAEAEAAEQERKLLLRRQQEKEAAALLLGNNKSSSNGGDPDSLEGGADAVGSNRGGSGAQGSSAQSDSDPTLPMARVYLRLLAESQQEASEAKRRCWELSQEVARLKLAVANLLQHPTTTAATSSSSSECGGGVGTTAATAAAQQHPAVAFGAIEQQQQQQQQQQQEQPQRNADGGRSNGSAVSGVGGARDSAEKGEGRMQAALSNKENDSPRQCGGGHSVFLGADQATTSTPSDLGGPKSGGGGGFGAGDWGAPPPHTANFSSLFGCGERSCEYGGGAGSGGGGVGSGFGPMAAPPPSSSSSSFSNSSFGGGGGVGSGGCSSSGYSSGHGGDALAMQHVARQALLRRQYDGLRHQLASSRSAADFFGKHASASKLADVDREVAELTRRQFGGPNPLTMEEALQRVDAQGLVHGGAHRHGSNAPATSLSQHTRGECGKSPASTTTANRATTASPRQERPLTPPSPRVKALDIAAGGPATATTA